MAKLDFTFDASDFLKAFNAGMETMFIAMNDFSELDEVLNCNRIVTQNDDKES